MLKTDKILKKIMKLMDKYREEALKLGFDHQATVFNCRRIFTHVHKDEVEIHLFDEPDHLYTFIDEQDAFREVKASDIDYVQNVLARKGAGGDIYIVRRLYLKNRTNFDFRTLDEKGWWDAYLKND